MEREYNKRKGDPVYSIRLKAGKRRTYFFDIRPTKSNDYYLTITESKRKNHDDGYDRHKIFLYKEDYHKFLDALERTLEYMKENLLPEYDFDEFTRDIVDEQVHDHDGDDYEEEDTALEEDKSEDEEDESDGDDDDDEEVDKW